jgi:hypothetical protein
MIVCGGLVATSLLFGSMAQPVSAVPNFKKAFESMYVKPNTPLAKEIETAKCNICHMGESKKMRNAYGQELAKYLKKTDKDNKPKIDAALKKVEDVHSDPANPKSPTYGELIKSGKLPVGG